MKRKLVWLGLLLAACGGRAASQNGSAEPSLGGSTSGGGGATSAGGAILLTVGGNATVGGDGTITIYEDGGTTVTLVPSDAGPDPSTQLIHPGGPLGECDSVPCEAGLTCIQPWSYNPSYHVCSFKCAKPETPSILDPNLKAQCEIRYAWCRLENPADLQCIPERIETP